MIEAGEAAGRRSAAGEAPGRRSAAGEAAVVCACACAALAPWLALAPLDGVPAAAANALALAAALHGAGVAVAWLARRRDVHPLLAAQWGAAALIGALGLAIALGVGGVTAQAVLLRGAGAVHTLALARRFAAYRASLAAPRPAAPSLAAASPATPSPATPSLAAPSPAAPSPAAPSPITARRPPGLWLPAYALLAAIAALHILGAAGDLGARPFDDDGHVLAQLQRLRDTGGLGDPIGYARRAQLGGQLALQALATLGGDVHLARLAEGVAFALVLGLARARLHPPGRADASRRLWGLLVVIAAAAFTYVRPDPAPCWTAAGLVLALHATLADRRPGDSPLPIAVTAGALVALRLELLPVAAVALAAAWWPERRSLRHTAVAAAGALAVAGPLLAARLAAWRAVPAATRAFLEPARPPLGLQLAIFAGAAAAGALLVAVAWRARSLRWLAAAAALSIAGVGSQLTGASPYAAGFLWPLAIATAIAAVADQARAGRRLTLAALLISLAVMALIYEGRTASGRRRWARRYIDLALDLDYLRTTSTRAPISGGYDLLLRPLPPGATVALWVQSPERLDYSARLRLLDLRTPRAAWMSEAPWWPGDPPQERLLARLRADYLLLEDTAPGLEAVARRHPVAAEAGGVRLIDLRAARPPAP